MSESAFFMLVPMSLTVPAKLPVAVNVVLSETFVTSLHAPVT